MLVHTDRVSGTSGILSSGNLAAILIAALSSVLGMLGGWLAAYAKVKGANLATKEDFSSALAQLRQNTQTVEDVKQVLSDRSRRVENTASYIERQIEEFYGPLFNLVHQIVLANHVQHNILTQRIGAGSLSPEQRASVVRFFQEQYFFPVHQEVNEILKKKLYLVEAAQLPASFYRYLRHALQEQAQANLWREEGIDTSYVKGEPYPNELYDTLKRDLDKLMNRYSELTSPNLAASNP
jgi:septal ring factor EnvC (AmiA/AmiB activator)